MVVIQCFLKSASWQAICEMVCTVLCSHILLEVKDFTSHILITESLETLERLFSHHMHEKIHPTRFFSILELSQIIHSLIPDRDAYNSLAMREGSVASPSEFYDSLAPRHIELDTEQEYSHLSRSSAVDEHMMRATESLLAKGNSGGNFKNFWTALLATHHSAYSCLMHDNLTYF